MRWRAAEARQRGYHEPASRICPWVFGSCAHEFTGANLRELIVNHCDHDHYSNPADCGNWELLCVYSHHNEHQRHLEMPDTRVWRKTPFNTRTLTSPR